MQVSETPEPSKNEMRVFYAPEPLPDETTCSIFLMGPTPRAGGGSSWRPDAIEELKELGFRGEVFAPEPRDGHWPAEYADQIDWENAALRRADRILVWIPRVVPGLPGLTTNDEWGYWKGRDPARLVFGAPEGAESVRYQQYYARRLGVPVYQTLADTCAAATADPEKLRDRKWIINDDFRAKIRAREATDPGARRAGGACDVPLHVWRTPSFQGWYAAQRAVGNELRGASVEWVFRVGRGTVLYWAVHADLYVAAEGRRKSNEVVIGRPDVAAVVLYHPGHGLDDTEVVLVQEYRAPAATTDGYVWEVPSGSSLRAARLPLDVGLAEVEEEVGLVLQPAAVRSHAARQVAGALSVHKAHVFSAELTREQVAWLKAEEFGGSVHGNVHETERTYVRIRTVAEIFADTRLDWATVGVILAVLRDRLRNAS